MGTRDAERTETPAQQPVTAIPTKVVYGVAATTPLVVIVALLGWGRAGTEVVVLFVLACLSLLALLALVSYMLFTGQFPPRIGRSGTDLPAKDVDDTGTSLTYLADTVAELVDRVAELEERVELSAGEGSPRPNAGVSSERGKAEADEDRGDVEEGDRRVEEQST